MSFKCAICGENSEPSQRAVKVILKSKTVYQDEKGEVKSDEYRDGLVQGTQIVKEGLAHPGCAAKN